MKKALVLFLLVAGFIYAAYRLPNRQEREAASVQAQGAGPVSEEKAERTLSAALAEQAADRVMSLAAAPAPPSAEKSVEHKGIFADAPVISSMVEYGPEPGQETSTRIVETSMKQPFVRIREIYEEQKGARVLVEQKAMVANQLMLERPEGLSEGAFFAALRAAGAKEIRPAGDAVVATFEARPHDPKALEDALARVRESLGREVTVEFNYIRRLI